MTTSFEFKNIVQFENLIPCPAPGSSGVGGSATGHDEIPSQFIVFIDPDNQEFFPKPTNERTLGISAEPDRDVGTEVEL